MADTDPDKPTLFSRLFGRKAETSDDPAAATPEGRPDYAAAAGDLAPALPSDAGASAGATPALPAELAGADLQPAAGIAPEDRGAAPGGTSASPASSAGWWRRLSEGMRRTSSSLSESVTSLFTKRKLDAATLDQLEDALVQADLGVDAAARIVKAVAQGR
ncbi:MAG TPA: signal recognition particle receptor subunit alpha, partial [Beijerinckiaceae bacterium]|nr:signal recognition particle receptor subunit alpha [Beijerinckiaceae bacterium]